MKRDDAIVQQSHNSRNHLLRLDCYGPIFKSPQKSSNMTAPIAATTNPKPHWRARRIKTKRDSVKNNTPGDAGQVDAPQSVTLPQKCGPRRRGRHTQHHVGAWHPLDTNFTFYAPNSDRFTPKTTPMTDPRANSSECQWQEAETGANLRLQRTSGHSPSAAKAGQQRFAAPKSSYRRRPASIRLANITLSRRPTRSSREIGRRATTGADWPRWRSLTRHSRAPS
jgi:hypothetical protein